MILNTIACAQTSRVTIYFDDVYNDTIPRPDIFYVYTYESNDTTNIDFSKIVLVDSLLAIPNPAPNQTIVYEHTMLGNFPYTPFCFYTKSGKRYNINTLLLSPYSNRTRFIQRSKEPQNVRIPR